MIVIATDRATQRIAYCYETYGDTPAEDYWLTEVVTVASWHPPGLIDKASAEEWEVRGDLAAWLADQGLCPPVDLAGYSCPSPWALLCEGDDRPLLEIVTVWNTARN